MSILEKIETYLEGIDIEMLSMEEMEHYTKTLIAIENKKLDDQMRKNMQEGQSS